MATAADDEELDTEEENDEVPYVAFDISVSPSDPSLELLTQQIERGDIIVPFYQRKYVWKIEQASRLVESFLMGLPVPQVFLYVNADDQLEVIDGQQRLMSVKYFIEGLFGPEDDRGRRQVLRLDARRSARLGFWPRLGGRDELSGVFGGMPSFASKTATRSANVVTCAACPAKASTCDTTSVISSSLDRACSASRSIQTWNHAARPPSTIPSAPTLSRPVSRREQLPVRA